MTKCYPGSQRSLETGRPNTTLQPITEDTMLSGANVSNDKSEPPEGLHPVTTISG